ncbi:transcriptional regulator, MarR family [Oleidesulfovibrio alaskensis G20]|uniref:Transcriptional regulator, MarR family n=2 Tax=Oleidesulfovibrio alaskensis TaxID=58180 RepID=Q315C6_OLEA2|nr:MarR family winged helix-turn-helix transcriptional regulator [Oleidesulfovibrio alaskensis]ABB37470.1 transcriptional regulator, MarR family [Oleidesulfovibrio alaskensis G20]
MPHTIPHKAKPRPLLRRPRQRAVARPAQACPAGACPCAEAPLYRSRRTSIGRAIALVARKTRMRLTETLAQLDLGAGQYPFVIALLRYGDCSQEQLAELTAMDKSTTARALKALEQKGFITRKPACDNRRMNIVHATSKAARLEHEIHRRLNAVNSELAAGLSARERRLLLRLLHILEDNTQAFSTL